MQQIIDAIHNINIVDVIQKYLPLKKEGANYKACCPFHDEKTPSFVVSPSKNRYNCFGGCGSGDAIKFVQEKEQLNFIDAVDAICKEHNIPFEKKLPRNFNQKEHNIKENIKDINEDACVYFKELLEQNTTDEKAYALRRFTKETIELFGIGLAPKPWREFLTQAKKKQHSLNDILQSNLVRFKNEKYYDFFRERLMFPIHDERGRVVGFTGRVFPHLEGEKDAKYMNSPESLAYNKSKVLYGLYQAKANIVKKGYAVIVEGQADVVSLHQRNINNSVAGSGTALDVAQLNLLKKYTDELLLIYDNDKAGDKAWVKNGKLAVQLGFNVSILQIKAGTDEIKKYTKKLPVKFNFPIIDWLQGQDPDSFFANEKYFNWYSQKYKEEYIIKFAEQFFKNGDTTSIKATALKDIALLLHNMDNEVRSIYIDTLKGFIKPTPLKSLTDKIKDMLNESKKETVSATDADDDDIARLPRGVDANDFLKYTFYEYKNQYHFKIKEAIVKCSNFTMKPLFHIKSINDSRRLYEIINVRNEKEVIDIEIAAMISIQMFKKVVESRGNYIWSGSDLQFTKLKMKLYDQTQTCELIEHLGWQKQGFWASANMVFDCKKIQEIDDNGIIEHKDKHYFLPALSSIYKNDHDVYVNERKFTYQPSNLKLYDWMELFTKVYGDAAKLAIPFLLSSIFRDIIYSKFKMFPILNLFGPPGTGKSQMARSMMYFFGEAQEAYNIHNGTKVGLAEHLSEFSNALAWIDEYKNNIDYDKVEMMKSVYDGVGRKKGSIDRGAKTKTSLIQQAVLLSGQEMPTADVALLKRVILVQFNKDKFSDAEKQRYDQLKEMEQSGLSHFLIEILKYREEMEKMYMSNFEDTLRDFNSKLKGYAIEDRILRNTVSIATTFKMFSEKYIKMPFSYDDYQKIAIANIKEQSDFILNSREIQVFWDIYAVLFERGEILEGIDFRIETITELNTNKGLMKLPEPTMVLFMRMAKVYTSYATLGKTSGQSILPEATLKYYLGTSVEFISTKEKVRFKTQVSNAYVFDYKKLNINLMKSTHIAGDADDIEVYDAHKKQNIKNQATKKQQSLPLNS